MPSRPTMIVREEEDADEVEVLRAPILALLKSSSPPSRRGRRDHRQA